MPISDFFFFQWDKILKIFFVCFYTKIVQSSFSIFFDYKKKMWLYTQFSSILSNSPRSSWWPIFTSCYYFAETSTRFSIFPSLQNWCFFIDRESVVKQKLIRLNDINQREKFIWPSICFSCFYLFFLCVLFSPSIFCLRRYKKCFFTM